MPGQNALMESIPVMTFLPNFGFTRILRSFKLVQERKAGQEMLSHHNYSS